MGEWSDPAEVICHLSSDIWTIMEFMNTIGYAVCHQIPDRSIFIDGKQLPVCARDTGLYIGSLLSLIFIASTNRRTRNAIPIPAISFTFVFFMLLLGIDGISSYLGMRTTTNGIRLMTGLLVGIGLPFFMYPLTIDSILSPKSEKHILSRWYELVVLMLLAGAAFLVILLFNHGLFIPISGVVTVGIIALHLLMLMTLASFLVDRASSGRPVKKLLASLPLAVFLLAIEFPLLIKLHQYAGR